MSDLSALMTQIRQEYPEVSVYAFEKPNSIYLSKIKVPHHSRGKGIGKSIIKRIQDYANIVKKPITLVPQAERGFKQKLDKFYKDLGFVHNKGRNKDFSLSDPFAPSMYWRFKEWLKEQ
jgi:hypothetical protein